MEFLIGVDVGGTFTDGVVVDEKGNLNIFKVPTTNKKPSAGFMNCLRKAAEFYQVPFTEFLSHTHKLCWGTTIATNALIQGKVARTGLITTKGHRDALPIARISREYLDIDLQVEKPPSLIPRHMIEEIIERVDYKGSVITPINMDSVEKAVDSLISKGAQAIAVCLLWSFKNPGHEKKVKEAIQKKNSNIFISVSHEIAPVIGEYERAATVTMNASLGPVIEKEIATVARELKANGLRSPLLLMQSIGGIIPAEDASMKPVTLINSGPVGGVTACGYFSKLLGEPNIIGIDMGGTSLDVSMVTQGEYSATLVSRVNNHNIFVPMVDVYSIGAGGGSIAWIDMGTRLKVGPNSAGADPGPACYNLGGEEPAVTDADVVLGRINPGYFLGGDMPLSAEKAAAAIKEKIADPMGMTVTQAAAGICQIVDAKMADAIRVVTVEKGYDPRDYALLAFGGAGPVHASALAYELGIKKIIVPFLATAQSAFGIVASDIVHNLVITDVMELSETEKINERFDKLETDGRKMLEGEDVLPEHVEIKRYADIRYKGQAHEVTIPVPAKSLDAAALSELADSFETRYISLFGPGTAFKEAGLEMVSMRVDATGKTKKPAMPEYPLQGKDSSPALKGERQVVMDYRAGFVNVKTYDGAKLNCGNSFPGPAVVEYPGTTVVMLSGQKSTVDKYKNLVIEWEG